MSGKRSVKIGGKYQKGTVGFSKLPTLLLFKNDPAGKMEGVQLSKGNVGRRTEFDGNIFFSMSASNWVRSGSFSLIIGVMIVRAL